MFKAVIKFYAKHMNFRNIEIVINCDWFDWPPARTYWHWICSWLWMRHIAALMTRCQCILSIDFCMMKPTTIDEPMLKTKKREKHKKKKKNEIDYRQHVIETVVLHPLRADWAYTAGNAVYRIFRKMCKLIWLAF